MNVPGPMPGPAFRRLALMPARHLDEVFRSGVAPDYAELAGREFLGWNPPRMAQLIGIGKFVKGFDPVGEPPAGGPPELLGRGYNRAVRRSRLTDPWVLAGPPGDAGRFGFYEVRRVRPDAPGRDARHPNALLLDYGAGGNPWWSPTRALRDYIVRVDVGPESVYLGKAYLALGPLRVFASHFLIGASAG